MENIIILGVFLILVGFVLILLGLANSIKNKAEFGGFVLIGPFPIVFGSSKSALLVALAVGAIVLIFLILLLKLGILR